MSAFVMAVVQMDSGADTRANLEKAGRLIDEAASRGAKFVALPENAHYCGPKEGAFAAAETVPGPASEFFAAKARRHRLWLHCGSIGTRAPGGSRIRNTTLLFSPSGDLAARYDKIHMYDVEIAGGPSARESDTVEPGGAIVTCRTDFCDVGLSICYDMRFPEVYRAQALMGAKLLIVPSCYTMFTGKDHWECLLRARAIENQCYVAAPGQIGNKPAYRAYGRSMIIDPWGVVTACAGDRECVICAEIDPAYADEVRAQLPSLKNRRPEAYRPRG